MRIIGFYHSLLSDWNHGNAHFLRGIASELIERGHDVSIYEPCDSWSYRNLVSAQGTSPISDFHCHYPALHSYRYDPDSLNLDQVLDGADLVLVHEWNDPELVKRIGEHKRGFQLLFHDTHHRSVTAPESMAAYDLSKYDGVLAFGNAIRDVYLRNGWADRVWTWHEAADVRLFRPLQQVATEGDLVWIGNWGDDERTEELRYFLIEPVRLLGLKARVYGVRYPPEAIELLRESGIEYGGWLPNFRVPEVFARYRVTVHVPRRPYATALPGIPTIRPFEALACGIPLISAPWTDSEGLFTIGRDFLMAWDQREMCDMLRAVLSNPVLARSLAAHGRQTILSRHSCAHRVDQLLEWSNPECTLRSLALA